MATTLQHRRTAAGAAATAASASAATQNPQLKRIVYSKYRELLGSYNDKANAIIETLPAYMVREDRGFNLTQLEPVGAINQTKATTTSATATTKDPNETLYGSRGNTTTNGVIGGAYEAPACVQNAMMSKDKKPFTYTPGGIDLSQIRSERMAKRLARNAQFEGATGAGAGAGTQAPKSPTSPSPGSAAASLGAAAMGMPFQVLPSPPPATPSSAAALGKMTNCAAAPPPPPLPPQQQQKQQQPQQHTLAPQPPPPPTQLATPRNAANGSSAQSSPSMPRRSPAPQRFEPPPLGFRPEIKIPPNPMAGLRKVAPPVEKNTFWKDEYCKEQSRCNNNGAEPANDGEDVVDAFKKTTPAPVQFQPQASPQLKPQQQEQRYADQYSNENGTYKPSTPPAAPIAPSTASPQPCLVARKPESPIAGFRSVESPQLYNRVTESPQRGYPGSFEQPQQQQRGLAQQMSPLAHQQQQQQQQQYHQPLSTPKPTANQSLPWRAQRSETPTQQIRSAMPEPTASQQSTQWSKPTNNASPYIAQPTEPQAPSMVRQHLQQQQQQQARASPIRQMQPGNGQQQLRWLSSQPAAKDQVPWARADEDSNVLPSSLNQRAKASQPMAAQYHQEPQQQQQQQSERPGTAISTGYSGYPESLQQQQQQRYQQHQANTYGGQSAFQAPTQAAAHNFGSHSNQVTGLRLQISPSPISANANVVHVPDGPRERIIPIMLEQTPPSTAANPTFGAPAGHIIRSANQFVDQGYNNYGSAAPANQQQQQPLSQLPTHWRDTSCQPRGTSPANQQQQQVQQPQQQQQQQQQQFSRNNFNGNHLGGANVVSGGGAGGGPQTRIIPVAIEGAGNGGAVLKAPIVLQK